MHIVLVFDSLRKETTVEGQCWMLKTQKMKSSYIASNSTLKEIAS